MYICSICKTPTAREGRCENCGWVKTITIKENSIAKSDSGKVVFITEDTQHLTGGRYYSWWLATAMKKAGFDVVIYTNRIPVFIDYFKSYPQPEVVITPNVSSVNVDALFYVGSPIIGSLRACQLSEKYGKTAYCEIFDPFPMMEKYRGGHTFPEWDKLIAEMKKPQVKIISLCKTTNEYIYSWLNKTKDDVFEIYPCINGKERDKSKVTKRENQVVFVSRLDYHKKPEDCLNAVKNTDCKLNVVTSIDGVHFDEMVKKSGMEGRVIINKSVSDYDKFKIIKKSKAMINGAIFEGFGMWLAEAISCGIPCVCYDYPTFREIAGDVDNVYFAKYNHPKDLEKKLKQSLSEGKFNKGTKRFDFPAMVKRVKEVFIRKPKIGVVQICLNEEQYIGASLKSIIKNENISKVAVVEGAVELFAHAATKDGLSVDKTKEKIIDVLENDKNGNKIIYERYGWASDKSELRNRALELLGKKCDYVLVVDADEVWKKEDLDKLADYVSLRPTVSVVWFPAYHFWKRKDLIAVGSQWDRHLFRFFKYDDKTLHWDRHEAPVVNKDGISVTMLGKEATVNKIHFYHYGYLKDEKRIKEKLDYYKKRDGSFLNVKNTWSNWQPGKSTQPTHGGGTVAKFNGEHPIEVKDLIMI